MRFHHLVMLLFSFATVARIAGAQAVPSADSARPETIEHLLSVTDMERVYTQTLQTSMTTRIKTNASIAPYADLIRDFTEKHASYQVIKPELIRLYRETFSESEVKELIQFYQSDFGRRMMPKLWAFNTRHAQIVADRIQAHVPELTAALVERGKVVPPM